jgi:hypothetical protein
MYFEEKANFAGVLIGGIFYGMWTHVFVYPHSPLDLSFKGSSSFCFSNP